MAEFTLLNLQSRPAVSTLRGPLAPPLIAAEPGRGGRTKLWEITPTLHCSIIGTCLSAGELRRFFAKMGDAELKIQNDHTLHQRGVKTAGQRDLASKQLHKTLDRKHELAIKRFAKATSVAEVRELWRSALEQGEIAGAYWAALTHPATDRALVQELFGEIHMLSHLVGSANRVDLARLRQLERSLAERDEALARQQERQFAETEERLRLRRQIETLEAELLQRMARVNVAPQRDEDGEAEALHLRLGTERSRNAELADRLAAAEAAIATLREEIAEVAEREAALVEELAAVESSLSPESATVDPDLRGRRLLYVGGRPGLVEQLRALVAGWGGELLAHDGGIEDSPALLPGLVSQASAAFFPVDCVSHLAASQVKKLCREAGKPFVPLRSGGLGSFAAAVGQLA